MKTYKITALILIILFFSIGIKAQDSSLFNISKNLELHGFIETYYNINSDKNNSLKIFPCISPYRDQFRLNIAQLSIRYNSEKIRSTFTMHYGDIPDINWESSTQFKYIQEANLGFSPVKNLWIDGGFFQTHLGAEGFPPNNFLNSNALISIAEPNIQGGVKISYEFSDYFTAALHIINGLNLFEDNNKNKSYGFELDFTPKDNLEISYNNIFGNEVPTDFGVPKVLFIHNVAITYSPTKKIDLLGNFDIAHQQNSKLLDSTKAAFTYGGLISCRYKFSDKFSATARGEFFQDLDGLLIDPLGNNTGPKANGFTIGGEYKPLNNAYLRLEYYFLRMDANQKIFYDNNNIRHEINLSFGFGI